MNFVVFSSLQSILFINNSKLFFDFQMNSRRVIIEKRKYKLLIEALLSMTFIRIAEIAQNILTLSVLLENISVYLRT
jgi:hypothetical protein